jgi:hypothetical protein
MENYQMAEEIIDWLTAVAMAVAGYALLWVIL